MFFCSRINPCWHIWLLYYFLALSSFSMVEYAPNMEKEGRAKFINSPSLTFLSDQFFGLASYPGGSNAHPQDPWPTLSWLRDFPLPSLTEWRKIRPGLFAMEFGSGDLILQTKSKPNFIRPSWDYHFRFPATPYWFFNPGSWLPFEAKKLGIYLILSFRSFELWPWYQNFIGEPTRAYRELLEVSRTPACEPEPRFSRKDPTSYPTEAKNKRESAPMGPWFPLICWILILFILIIIFKKKLKIIL